MSIEAQNVDRGDDFLSEVPDLDETNAGEVTGEVTGEVEPSEAEDKIEQGEKPEKVEEKNGKKPIQIPKSRFDEVQKKAREREASLQEQITKLNEQLESRNKNVSLDEVDTKLSALEESYEEALLDGKRDEARKIRNEIRQLNQHSIEIKTNAKSVEATRVAIDQIRYDSALAQVEQNYAQLNPDSEDFDAATTEEVSDLMEAYVRGKGLSRAVALQKAVRYVLGKPETRDHSPEVTREKRAAAARKTAADAARRQAPEIAGKLPGATPTDKATIDVNKLSQSAFAKLDEDTLRKLRGDDE